MPAPVAVAAAAAAAAKLLPLLIEALPHLKELLKQLKAKPLADESIAAAVRDVLEPELEKMATEADLAKRTTELETAMTEVESRLIRWIVASAAVLVALIVAATAVILTAG